MTLEDKLADPRLQIPNSDIVVVAPGHCGGPMCGNRPHGTRMASEMGDVIWIRVRIDFSQLLGRSFGQSPNPQRTIAAACHDDRRVSKSRLSDAPDRAGMATERMGVATRLNVPDPNGRVCRASGEDFVVGSNWARAYHEVPYAACVAGEGPEEFPGVGRVHRDSVVVRCREDAASNEPETGDDVGAMEWNA